MYAFAGYSTLSHAVFNALKHIHAHPTRAKPEQFSPLEWDKTSIAEFENHSNSSFVFVSIQLGRIRYYISILDQYIVRYKSFVFVSIQIDQLVYSNYLVNEFR